MTENKIATQDDIMSRLNAVAAKRKKWENKPVETAPEKSPELEDLEETEPKLEPGKPGAV